MRDTVYRLSRSALPERRPVDVNNRLLQERFNCTVFSPNLAWGESGYSDTHQRAVNPWWPEGISASCRTRDGPSPETKPACHTASGSNTRALGVRNLFHVVNAYRKTASGCSIAVVEQDGILSLDSGGPITAATTIRIKDPGPLNRGRCFNEAVRRLGATRTSTYLLNGTCGGDGRSGRSAECLSYDFVSSFSQLIDLTEEDTARIVGQNRSRDQHIYRGRYRTEICAEFCTLPGLRLSG